MNLDLKHVILFISFIPVANSLTCYVCESMSSTCDKSSLPTCEGGSCMKFNADFLGVKISAKSCVSSTSTGCKSDSMFGYSGTTCFCNSNYCNHSSNDPKSLMATCFAMAWIILKFLF